MKKLFIALAVVGVTAISSAASIKWAVNAPGKGATYKDYRVYICESITAFENETQISGFLLGSGENTGTIASNRGDAFVIGTITGLDNAKSGQMQAFKVVIVDKDSKGYWVTDGSAEIFTTSDTHVDFNLADASPLLATPATAFGTSPVPEPTSGLMILLGFGLMTLKRKRA